MKNAEIGSKTANINTKNNSLSKMLMVTDQSHKNHKKGDITERHIDI